MTVQDFILPRFVIFDWDNTLVSTWRTTTMIMNHVLQHFGMPLWTFEEIQQKTHLSAKDYFPILFKEKADEAFQILRKYVNEGQEEQLKELIPMPGAEELLIFLQRQQIPCAILSNKHGQRLRAEVDYLNWNHYFKGIFGSLDFCADKPSALPARAILEKFHQSSDYTWFVGDTPVDWQCAQNSGCIPISIVKECSEVDPKYIFSGCEALLNKLQEIMK